jgi:hypothetical protein
MREHRRTTRQHLPTIPCHGRGGGVSGNTERVLRAVRRVAAAAMWPETPSWSRAFSGRAGSAIFVPTACRSVAGGSACPRSGLSRQRTDLEIVIIPAADQHYLSANVVPRGRPTCHHHVRPGQTLCRAAPECVMTAPKRVIDAPNRRMTAPQCVMTGLGPTRFTQVWNV